MYLCAYNTSENEEEKLRAFIEKKKSSKPQMNNKIKKILVCHIKSGYPKRPVEADDATAL